MFFAAAKFFAFLARPSNLLIVAAVIGVALMMTRFSQSGRRLVAVSVVLLAVLGLSPLGNVLIRPLEQRFPQWDETCAAPDAIIVLGGSIGPEVSAERGVAALNESAERLTAVADLARRFPAARIIFSGGNGNVFPGDATEAQFAVKLFESFGIARQRILIEDRSRNTAENARFTEMLVAPRPNERWLLVTSAYHMPRAVGAFRQAGFTVEPYPVDWRTGGGADLLRPFRSVAEGLQRTDTAMREWFGLVGYRITGKSSALFPAP